MKIVPARRPLEQFISMKYRPNFERSTCPGGKYINPFQLGDVLISEFRTRGAQGGDSRVHRTLQQHERANSS